VSGQITTAAQHAFIKGFSTASLVAVGAVTLGAIVALVFLPARHREG
jgi:hypothetical protein